MRLIGRPPVWSAVVMVLMLVLSASTASDRTIGRGRLALHLAFMAFATGALAWFVYARRRRR
jgi:hypothetical protein